MWGIVVSALGRVVGWLLGAGTMQWVVAAVLWFGLASLLDLLLDLLPSWFGTDGLTSATSVFTPQIWYFIDYFNVQEGLSMLLSAYAIRFLIRRIPVIG